MTGGPEEEVLRTLLIRSGASPVPARFLVGRAEEVGWLLGTDLFLC